MYSFSNYKDQCYNFGSPNPSPSCPPLRNLSTVSDFDFSPIEGSIEHNTAQKSKRKRDFENFPQSPTKKQKMMTKEEMSDLLQENNKYVQGLLDKMDGKMEAGFSTLSTFLLSLKETMDINDIKMNNGMATLEKEFTRFQENTAEEAKLEIQASVLPSIEAEMPKVKEVMKKEVLEAADGAWKVSLADKIKEHEHCAIVFGLRVVSTPLEDAYNFIRNNLKVNAEDSRKFNVINATRLGRGTDQKPPGLLIKFSHPGERNFILSYSKNLKGTRMKIEKHVPKLYQNEHKLFKKTVFELSRMPGMNYQT